VATDGDPQSKTVEYEPILICPDWMSNTPEPKTVLCFNISEEMEQSERAENELNSGSIPQIVADKFIDNHIAGSREQIFLTKNENPWKVYDFRQDRTYIIRKEDNALNVYREPIWSNWQQAQVIVQAGIDRRKVQRAGPHKKYSPPNLQPKVQVNEEGYCIAYTEDLRRADLGNNNNQGLTHMAADQLLSRQLELHPDKAGDYLVIPEYEVTQ
jgi:hypothetical protein